MTTDEGRVHSVTRDWCLTCKTEATENHDHAHDVVCRPALGWGNCDCRSCRKVIKQMEASGA